MSATCTAELNFWRGVARPQEDAGAAHSTYYTLHFYRERTGHSGSTYRHPQAVDPFSRLANCSLSPVNALHGLGASPNRRSISMTTVPTYMRIRSRPVFTSSLHCLYSPLLQTSPCPPRLQTSSSSPLMSTPSCPLRLQTSSCPPHLQTSSSPPRPQTSS